LANLDNKLVNIGDDRFYILGRVSVECKYNIDELKTMWGLADAILRNGEQYYVCMKLIETEIQ
jgi:hypothetical protein